MAKLVESIYGNALFSAAKEQDKLSKVREEAEEIISVLNDNPDYRRILEHPDIETSEKLSLISEAFEGKADPLITGTLVTLIEKDHPGKIVKTLRTFIELSLSAEGIGVASVTSSFPLSDEQKKRITDKLIETTRYSRMRMDFNVDKKIIGGLVIKLGDKMLDSSIATKLETLRKSLERNM